MKSGVRSQPEMQLLTISGNEALVTTRSLLRLTRRATMSPNGGTLTHHTR
jgi:hypothetical protein